MMLCADTAGAIGLDDTWMSDGTSHGMSDDGFDMLDLECFNMMIEGDEDGEGW
jgi:hypothetical protein